MSLQDLQQNPQDTSNFYLANIYQLLADPNRSNFSNSLPTSPPPFSPPTFAVWVNGLWFLSLVISISCAVLATLLQQWARRYLKVTQTRYSLHKRARIRSFFAEGVEKSLLPWAVEALPTLLHVSLVLFFAGLAVFLWNVNLTIFKMVLSWIGVCAALYGSTMLISIFRCDSPYHTPLTPLALPVLFVIAQVTLVALTCYGGLQFIWTVCFSSCGPRIPYKADDQFGRFVRTKISRFIAPEKTALGSPADIDTRALMWTFGRLDEDHELVRFFSGLPGFHTSKVLKDPLRGLTDEQKLEIFTAIIGFLDRTFSSDLLSDRVKRQRADICEKAIDLVDTPEAFPQIVHALASAHRYNKPVLGPVQSTETVQFVRRLGNRKGKDTTTPVIRALFSIAVASVQRHDDSWFILASSAMAIPEAVLRSHAVHRDSLSLVILIHIIRQQFTYLQTTSWPVWKISLALWSASEFDVRDTSPELQHEFCALWNQMVRAAQDRRIALYFRLYMLDYIRGVYTALHQGTDSGLIYDFSDLGIAGTVCNVPSHVLDESAPTTFPRTVQQHDHTLAIASLTSPDAPSSSIPAPPHVDENLTVPPLDNSHPTRQPVDTSLTSLDPSKADAIQDIVSSGITTSYPTPEAATSPPPPPSTSPPDLIFLQDKADPLTSSNLPNLPSPASGPIRNNMLPAGPSLSTHFLIARTDLTPSVPEIRCPLTATSASNASLVPTSDLGTPAEEDGNPTHKEKDALDPLSLHHAIDTNTIPTTAPPPQPPSLLSVTESDVAIIGRSAQERNSEPTGGRPPDPSHYRYDIV